MIMNTVIAQISLRPNFAPGGHIKEQRERHFRIFMLPIIPDQILRFPQRRW